MYICMLTFYVREHCRMAYSRMGISIFAHAAGCLAETCYTVTSPAQTETESAGQFKRQPKHAGESAYNSHAPHARPPRPSQVRRVRRTNPNPAGPGTEGRRQGVRACRVSRHSIKVFTHSRTRRRRRQPYPGGRSTSASNHVP